MGSRPLSHLIYCRASTPLAESLALQEKRLQAFAKRRGLRIGGVFTDSVSARTHRPGFLAMLKRIDAGGVAGVLAVDASRLARNTHDTAELMSRLQVGILQSVYTLRNAKRFSLESFLSHISL